MLLIILVGGLSQTSSNASVSAPAIAWKREYEGITAYVSNVIQTSDGGYAFMDTGHARYSFSPVPSVIYKVDSLGNVQWNKTMDNFLGSTIIQTSDEGYEMSGRWQPPSPTYDLTPTIIKTDSQGNIQWVANYSSIPDLGINPTNIQTSDGGFAYLQHWTVSLYGTSGIQSGGIVKTDSNYNTQWVMNLTCPYPQRSPNGTFPLALESLIETSDGALVGVGVGRTVMSNPPRGHIYLIKTEPFLSLPQQTPLPTPVLTPIAPPTPTPEPKPNVEAIVITSIIIGMVAGASLTLLLKKRKH